MDHLVAFTLSDVVRKGFEARCVGPDGSRYLWHGDAGLRTDVRTACATRITDLAVLPDSPWFPTRLGLEELERMTRERE